MVAIHHAVAKKAVRHGIVLTVQGDIIVATSGDSVISSGVNATLVLNEAIAALGAADAPLNTRSSKSKPARKQHISKVKADEENAGEADEEDAGEGKSVIKRKYKQAYRPFKMTCGDDLAALISAHVCTAEKVDGKTVKRINIPKLMRFAKANDCWVSTYRDLNPGMQRMNIANRLRSKVKHGHEVVWA